MFWEFLIFWIVYKTKFWFRYVKFLKDQKWIKYVFSIYKFDKKYKKSE